MFKTLSLTFNHSAFFKKHTVFNCSSLSHRRSVGESFKSKWPASISICCRGLCASGLSVCVCMCLSVYGDTSVCPVIHSLSRAAGWESRWFESLRDLDIARLGAPGPIRPGRSSPTRSQRPGAKWGIIRGFLLTSAGADATNLVRLSHPLLKN